MNIIFDLDGTLIDSKPRLYNLFCDLTPQLNISFDEYWALKFSRKTNFDILSDLLGYQENDLLKFHEEWMSLIETPNYLSMDKPIAGTEPYLSKLKQQADLYVCTDRQFEKPVTEQLDGFGFSYVFSQILVTHQRKTKAELIKSKINNLDKNDWMIGDTGKDINAGKELVLKTCAVLSGFMRRDELTIYGPDLILDYATTFLPPPKHKHST